MIDEITDCINETNRQVHKCHTQKPENKEEDEAPLVYTARDLADAYVEGFKDGFNHAVTEQHKPDKDVDGYG